MPIYEFQCDLGHVTEALLPVEHEKTLDCRCGEIASQIHSRVSFKFAGRVEINDGNDDPWEGTPLEGMGEPDVLRYKSDKIFVDQGKKTPVGARNRPEDWAQKVALAQPV